MRIILALCLILLISVPCFALEDSGARRFVTGQKTVTSAGTGEPLSDDTSTFYRITISPLPSNTSSVYVARAAEQNDSSFGYALTKSADTVVLPITTISTISIDVVKSGEGVSWIGLIR